MNPNSSRSLLLVVAAVAGIAAAPASAADQHAQMVTRHGARVMPFDQKTAQHMFLDARDGGVVQIVVRTMDERQISLVRSHLLDEASKFAHGNYGDPAYIHGASMPGLARLRSGAPHISVRYFETPTGAAITLSSKDRTLVAAIHAWLGAQRHDHAAGGADGGMKM